MQHLWLNSWPTADTRIASDFAAAPASAIVTVPVALQATIAFTSRLSVHPGKSFSIIYQENFKNWLEICITPSVYSLISRLSM